MNHAISLFCRRDDAVQKKVGQIRVKNPVMLCGALDQDLGSLEFSPWVTPGTIGYRMGLRTPDFLLSCSHSLSTYAELPLVLMVCSFGKFWTD